MKSLQVGTFFGIPIKIHWTFSLLWLFMIGVGIFNGSDATTLISLSFFIISMFICVILHEYGHALTARKYGIKTLDIIISPIGGIARLQKLPEKPIHELIVAIAGPLVNLFIAIVLAIIVYFGFNEVDFSTPEELVELLSTPLGFLSMLIWINTVLFVFNLVPAFPMDGGRILRAFLSMKYGKVKGTQYASVVGRILAIGFICAGIFMSYILIFIGVFVYIMAKSENEQIAIQSKLSKFQAKDIMNVNFTRLHLSTRLEEVYQKYIRGGEKNYIVFDSLGNVSGVLPELFIKEAFKEEELSYYVSEHMSNNVYFTNENIPLDKLFEDMNVKGVAIAIIKNDDQILGVVDRQMLHNFMQLQMSK